MMMTRQRKTPRRIPSFRDARFLGAALLLAASALPSGAAFQYPLTSARSAAMGGVSVYGLGRFPVTLYKEQWTKLLAMADDIRAFVREHEGELKAKEPR